MGDESKSDDGAGGNIASEAFVPAQHIVTFVTQATPSMLVAIAALEAAKQTIFMMARESMTPERYQEFVEKSDRLIRGFDGCQEAAEGIAEGAFMGPSGNA